MRKETGRTFAGSLRHEAFSVIGQEVLERTVGSTVDRFLDRALDRSTAREIITFPLRKGIERFGFIPVEEEKTVALTAKVDTQRALWALKGLDHLLPNRIDDGNSGGEHARIDDLRNTVSQNKKLRKTHGEDVRLEALVHRLMGVRQRREVLEEVLSDAESGDWAVVREAKRRLALVMDIVDDKFEKPNPDGHKAVILTQTAYLLGDEGEKRPEPRLKGKLRHMEKLGVDLASGSMPYLGAAVVYAELMATGRFSDIEIIDFRDTESIEVMLQRKDRDFAFISGATTFDGSLIEDLNQKLSAEGLKVVNGGVAAGISRHPESYLANGGSIFVGDFEGAADRLIDELEDYNGPQVFVRGANVGRKHRLDRQGVPYTTFSQLPERALLHAAYSPDRELDGERLANRLLALEMMRPTVEIDGKTYEPPVSLKIHETSTSYGCPETCSFCATVPLQGINMRARSTESLRQEWEAVEVPHIAIVDQNFIANGRDNTTGVLKVAEALGKRVAFEGELAYFSVAPPGHEPFQNYFFDGTEADRERERLLKTSVTAIAVGLEQPVKVRGTRDDKDPDRFTEAQARLNKLGIKTFGTIVVGMPPQLWDHGQESDLNIVPYAGMPAEKWEDMVNTWTEWAENIGVVGPVIFDFSAIEGTPAFDRLEKEDLLHQRSNGQFEVDGIDGRRAVMDIRKGIYSLPSVLRRINNTNLSPRDKAIMFFYNAVAARAFRLTMD